MHSFDQNQHTKKSLWIILHKSYKDIAILYANQDFINILFIHILNNSKMIEIFIDKHLIRT